MSKSKKLIVDKLDCFAEEFEKINLSQTTIKKAEFEECTFIACDFSETFFHSCRFIDCRFLNCNLSLMKLTDTTMSGCEFMACKMIGIDWTMCDWKSLLSSETLEFRDSILNDSNFFGLKLDGLVMKKCSVKDVDFRLGSFMKADFSSSDFKGAWFDKTHVEYANFTDTANTQINLQMNYIKGAIFNKFEALFLLESLGIVLVD
ncbi:MAG: pentapeptide repeat-containing protein [Sulfurimonadaceae bacterium]|nr:pentapeptide repeat-containing protein [Sulfurimonadaceae bacterium]